MVTVVDERFENSIRKDHSHSNVSQRAGTDPCTTSGSALFRCSSFLAHTELTLRAFSVAAPSTWNSLPAEIRL